MSVPVAPVKAMKLNRWRLRSSPSSSENWRALKTIEPSFEIAPAGKAVERHSTDANPKALTVAAPMQAPEMALALKTVPLAIGFPLARVAETTSFWGKVWLGFVSWFSLDTALMPRACTTLTSKTTGRTFDAVADRKACWIYSLGVPKFARGGRRTVTVAIPWSFVLMRLAGLN